MDTAQSGPTATVSGAAYTNSVLNATATTQYTIDAATDALYTQGQTGSVPPGPNGGVQTLV